MNFPTDVPSHCYLSQGSTRQYHEIVQRNTFMLLLRTQRQLTNFAHAHSFQTLVEWWFLLVVLHSTMPPFHWEQPHHKTSKQNHCSKWGSSSFPSHSKLPRSRFRILSDCSGASVLRANRFPWSVVCVHNWYRTILATTQKLWLALRYLLERQDVWNCGQCLGTTSR